MIGLGYIGLPTAVTIASCGANVVGVDTNEALVATVMEGKAHFHEPGLDSLLQLTLKNGKFGAKTRLQKSDVFIIAVPTPVLDNKKADLTSIEAVCDELVEILEPGNTIILESTSPQGTTSMICDRLSNQRRDLHFPNQLETEPNISIAYCPERILPGQMLSELVNNDRIIGGMTAKCAENAKQVYEYFVSATLHVCDASTAEVVKLMENAYRDLNIAFANELSIFCEKFEINVWNAIHLANMHPRVDILKPGPGVGGHCIAVDPWFLVSAAPNDTPLMRTARHVNDTKPEKIVSAVNSHIAHIKKPVIACLGLTYKANVDDLRESPSVSIVKSLAGGDNVKVLVVEPNIKKLPNSIDFKNVLLTDFHTALDRANVTLVLVAHEEFKAVDHDTVDMSTVFDTVGIWQVGS